MGKFFHLVDEDLTIYEVTLEQYRKILQDIVDGKDYSLPTGVGQADDISAIADDPDMAEEILESLNNED